SEGLSAGRGLRQHPSVDGKAKLLGIERVRPRTRQPRQPRSVVTVVRICGPTVACASNFVANWQQFHGEVPLHSEVLRPCSTPVAAAPYWASALAIVPRPPQWARKLGALSRSVRFPEPAIDAPAEAPACHISAGRCLHRLAAADGLANSRGDHCR